MISSELQITSNVQNKEKPYDQVMSGTCRGLLIILISLTPFLHLKRHLSRQKTLIMPSHCLKTTQDVAFEFLTFWHFPPIFVLLKPACLVTLFDRKLQVFKNSPKWTIFGIFN